MKPIFLVGYMGCGKSTLGRKLARRLGASFVDTDAAVEELEGASVAVTRARRASANSNAGCSSG